MSDNSICSSFGDGLCEEPINMTVSVGGDEQKKYFQDSCSRSSFDNYYASQQQQQQQPLSVLIPVSKSNMSSTGELALPIARNMSMEGFTASNSAPATLNFSEFIKDDIFMNDDFYTKYRNATATSPTTSTPTTAVGTFSNLASLLSPSSPVSTTSSTATTTTSCMNMMSGVVGSFNSPISPNFSKLRISSSPMHSNNNAPPATPTLDFAFGMFGGSLAHNAVRQLKEEAAAAAASSGVYHLHHHGSSSCDSLNEVFMTAIGLQEKQEGEATITAGVGLDSTNLFQLNKTDIIEDALLTLNTAFAGGEFAQETASLLSPSVLSEQDIMNLIMSQQQQQQQPMLPPFSTEGLSQEEIMMMAAALFNYTTNNDDEYYCEETSQGSKSNSRRGSSADAVDDDDGDEEYDNRDSKRHKSNDSLNSKVNNNKKYLLKHASDSSSSLEAMQHLFTNKGVVTAAESAKSRNWKCFIPGCDRVYNTGAGLRYHVKNHHQLNLLIKATRKPKKEKRREWTCTDCNRSYTSLPGLKYHQSTAEHKATVASISSSCKTGIVTDAETFEL